MTPHNLPGDEEKAVSYKNIHVSCAAFKPHDLIPRRYTCDGANVNPPLKIDPIPGEAVSLAIIVEDPDAPAGTWVHWVIWNIPVTHHLKEDHAPGTQGLNDFGKTTYSGPCPPKGKHRYFFKVYALDCKLDLPAHARKADLEKAMGGHVIAFGELEGLYERV